MRNYARVVLIFSVAAVLLFIIALPCLGDDLRLDREQMRGMLSVVASDIEKNFYDPQLKGLNWKTLVQETKQKIDNAKSRSEMLTAIFVLVEKVQDSHTKFIPPSRAVRPVFGFEAKAFGDEIRVCVVHRNSAAELAGLQVGDRVLSVNGYRAERNSFDLMMLDMRRLRPVARMDMRIARGNEPPQMITVNAKLIQEAIHKDIERVIEDIWFDLAEGGNEYFYSGSWDGVAYVSVPSFMLSDLGGLIDKLRGGKAVVIDLRDNPGGLLDTLLNTAGYFENAPTTMGDSVSRKKTEPLKIKPRKPNFAVPMFILVDSRSASAAEMFARHFQRTGKAVIVGDRTPGRVNGSRFFDGAIGSDSVVPFGTQISVSRLVLPNGEELEHKGVTPDVICVPTGDDMRERRDPCLVRAVSEARKKLGLPAEVPALQLTAINGITVSRNNNNSEPVSMH